MPLRSLRTKCFDVPAESGLVQAAGHDDLGIWT